MNTASLEHAVAARFPGAVLADQDGDSAYLVYPGRRGLRRVQFAQLGGGKVLLSDPERMKPRTTETSAMVYQTVEQRLAALETSTASLRERLAQKPAAAAGGGAAAVGEAVPAVATAGDYAPLPASSWPELALPKIVATPPFGPYRNPGEIAALANAESDLAEFPELPWDRTPTSAGGGDYAPIPPAPWDAKP